MRQIALPALLLAAGLLTQCRHRDPDPAITPPVDPLSLLPPETQTGQRTFGCLVNGQAYATVTAIQCSGDWQSANDIFLSGSMRENADFHGDRLSTGMLLHGTLQAGQIFNLVPLSTSTKTANNVFATNIASLSRPCNYQGNYIKAGQIILTKFDGVARIAAGRFAFTIYEPSGCDTLRVTNGRFDIKF